MSKLIILIACCLLAGSCSVFKPTVGPEFQERYTITYESTGPKPPIQTLPSKDNCPYYSAITLTSPPAPPNIRADCERDFQCITDASDEMAEYIVTLRTIMAQNREIVREANKRYANCQSK